MRLSTLLCLAIGQVQNGTPLRADGRLAEVEAGLSEAEPIERGERS